MDGVLSSQNAQIHDQSPNKYVKLEKISTQAATPSAQSLENAKYNLKQGYPKLQSLPEFRKVKGRDKKIALIGGGPSINNYIDDIKQFKTTIACGSSNDWMMNNGIIPTYAAICDPDSISINYYNKTDTEVKYLIASCCDPKIFEHLKDRQIVLWHCHSDEIGEKLKELEPGYEAVGGGCTVGLRALSIAIMMGYNNIHFFGFDSCLGVNDQHHAYDFSTDIEELGQIYSIKIGDENILKDNAKEYRCAGYQLAQAHHFKEFYRHYNLYFIPTFYGDGLISATMNFINEETARLNQEKVGVN